jgi:uncharacterized protein YcgL (UPF0745 family)
MKKKKDKEGFIAFIVNKSMGGINYATILAYKDDYNLSRKDVEDCIKEAKEQGVYVSHTTYFDGYHYMHKGK